MLWLLLTLSVVSVAVMIERFIFFRHTKLDFGSFSDRVSQKIIEKDTDAAKIIFKESPAIELQIVLRGGLCR